MKLVVLPCMVVCSYSENLDNIVLPASPGAHCMRRLFVQYCVILNWLKSVFVSLFKLRSRRFLFSSKNFLHLVHCQSVIEVD